VADWLVDTSDLRLDRGMPGDGVIDIPRIRALVEGAGYSGHREVEIFSQDNWWRRDPDEVLEIIKARYWNSI
jgi:sugar phosphate isomerase/epimerase